MFQECTIKYRGFHEKRTHSYLPDLNGSSKFFKNMFSLVSWYFILSKSFFNASYRCVQSTDPNLNTFTKKKVNQGQIHFVEFFFAYVVSLKQFEKKPGAAWKKIKSWSRSSLNKKSGAGAGAAKKFAGSPVLLIKTFYTYVHIHICTYMFE